MDVLWQVEDESLRVPNWSTTVSPDKRNPKVTPVSPIQQKIDGGRAAPQTTDSDCESIPGLVYASDVSSIDAAADGDDKSEDEGSDLDVEEQGEYDSEEEAELQDLEREAMDIASAYPEIFDEQKAFEGRSNDNNLLKALGALRGEYQSLG